MKEAATERWIQNTALILGIMHVHALWRLALWSLQCGGWHSLCPTLHLYRKTDGCENSENSSLQCKVAVSDHLQLPSWNEIWEREVHSLVFVLKSECLLSNTTYHDRAETLLCPGSPVRCGCPSSGHEAWPVSIRARRKVKSSRPRAAAAPSEMHGAAGMPMESVGQEMRSTCSASLQGEIYW